MLWVGASCKVQTQYLPACWVLWVEARCKPSTYQPVGCSGLELVARCKPSTYQPVGCSGLELVARCKPSTYQPVGCSGLEPVQGSNPVPTSLLGALGWSQYKVQTQYLPACWVLWVGDSTRCKPSTYQPVGCSGLKQGANPVPTSLLGALGWSKVQTQYLPACWVLWVEASTRFKPSTYQPVGCSGLEPVQGANPVPTSLLGALGWSQYKVQTQYLPACWVLWVGARCKPSTYQPVGCSGLKPVQGSNPVPTSLLGALGWSQYKVQTQYLPACWVLWVGARCKPSTYQPVGWSGLEPVQGANPVPTSLLGALGWSKVQTQYLPACWVLWVGASTRCKPSTYQPVGCSGLEQGANPVPTSLLGALGWSKVQTQYLPACWVLWVGASTRCKPSTYQPVGCSGLKQGANPVPTSLLGALGWSKVQTQYLPACWVLWVGASTRCKPSTYQPVGCSGLKQGSNPVPTSLLGALGWSQYKVQTQYLPACWVLWVEARCKPSTYQPVGCSGLEQGANPVPTSLLGALGWSQYKVQTQYLPACWVLWVEASTRFKPSTYQPVGCSGLEQGANPVPTSLLGALGWSQYKVQTQYLPACWVLWVGASTRCKPSTYQPVGCSGLKPVQGSNPVPTSLLGALGWSKVQTQYLPAWWVLWVEASTRFKPSTYQPVGCSGLKQGANPVPTSLLGALGWSQYKVQTQYLPACWVLWVEARCKPSTYQPDGCSGLEPVQGANPVPTSLLGALGWSKVQTQYLPACWVLWVEARFKPSTYQPVGCSGLEPVQGANPVPTSLLGALGWSKVQTQYLPACWVLWVGARCKPSTYLPVGCSGLEPVARCKPSTYQPVGCSGLKQGANPVPTSLLGALGWSKVQTQYLPACWVLWVGASCKVQTQYLPACWVLWVEARCKPSTYQPVGCSGLKQGANPVPTSLLGALGWSKVQTQYLPACWVLWVGASCKVQTQYLPACWVLWVEARCKPSTYQPVGCSGLKQGANPVPTSMLGALGWSKVQTQYLPACWVLWVEARCKPSTYQPVGCSGLKQGANPVPTSLLGALGWSQLQGANPVPTSLLGALGWNQYKVQTQYLPACWVLWVEARCKPSTYQPVGCSGLEPVQGANPVPTSLLGALGWSKVQTQYLPACWVLWVEASCKVQTQYLPACWVLWVGARCKVQTQYLPACWVLWVEARFKPSTYQPVGCSGLEPVQGVNPVPTSLLGALGWSKVQTQYLPACWVLWVEARCKPSAYQPVGCSGLEPVARCKPSTYQPVGCSGLEPVQGANPVPTSLLGALGWSQYKVQTQYLPACWVLWVEARCKPSTYQPVGCSGLEPVQGANPVPTSLLGALGWSKVQTQYLPACWVLWVEASCKVQTQYLPACWVLWVGASTRSKPSTYQPVGCSGLKQGANPVPTSLLGALGWSKVQTQCLPACWVLWVGASCKVQTQYLPACWVLWVGASTRCKPSTYQPVGCSGLKQGANPVPTSLLGALGWSQYKVQTQYLPACWVLWVGARCKPSTYQPVGCSGLEPVQGANPVPTSLLGALGWSKVQTQNLPACWVLWVGASCKVQTQNLPACWVLWVGARCKPSTYQPVGCSGLKPVARCKPSTYQPVGCSGLEPVQGVNPVPTSLLGALGWSKVQTQYLPACWVLWVEARCKPSAYQPVGCSGLEPVARCKPSTYQPVGCSGLEPVQGANPVPTSLLGALGWSKVQTQYLPACWVLWVGASTRCKPSTYQPVGCSGLEQGANPVPTSLLGALGWSQYKVQTQYLPACWVLWVEARCKPRTYQPVGCSGLEPVARCKPRTYQPVGCSGLEQGANPVPTSLLGALGWSQLQGANPVPTSLLGALGWSQYKE